MGVFGQILVYLFFAVVVLGYTWLIYRYIRRTKVEIAEDDDDFFDHEEDFDVSKGFDTFRVG